MDKLKEMKDLLSVIFGEPDAFRNYSAQCVRLNVDPKKTKSFGKLSIATDAVGARRLYIKSVSFAGIRAVLDKEQLIKPFFYDFKGDVWSEHHSYLTVLKGALINAFEQFLPDNDVVELTTHLNELYAAA